MSFRWHAFHLVESAIATDPTQEASNVDFKLELVVVPVSDVDRAKAFYWTRPASAWTSTTAPARSSGSSS